MQNTVDLIEILKQGMSEVSNAENPEQINQILGVFLKKIFASDYISLLLLDRQTNTFYCDKGNRSISTSMVHAPGLLGNCFLTKQPGIYNHVKSEKLFIPEIDNPNGHKFKSQILYPLVKDDTLIGVLRMSRSIKVSQNYTNNDLIFLKTIEPYLFKLVNLLLNNNEESKVEIDQDEIRNKLNEVKKSLEENQEKFNETMLFLANTVHDIRTPANSLYGFLELIEEKVKDKKLLDFITNAKESAAFINKLTDSILDRVKYENEASLSESITINTVNFLASTAEIFTGNMTNKNINYLIDIDPNLPKEILLDAMKLKRVLINLIGNAYKFTPKGGNVTFKTKYIKDKETLKFTIKDTGLGIPKERQQEIFKAFEQAHDETKVHFGGTGLGLSISSKYVQELGGTLELESEVDEGSSFYFNIPVSIVDETPSYILLNDDKHVVIYTDDTTSPHANLIKKYLVKLKIDENKIVIHNEIPVNTTHMVCLEDKLDDQLVEFCEKNNIKLLVLENSLFSVSEKSGYEELPILTKNTYYGNMLYTLASCRRKPKILIIDDNKINVKLLESILEGEYCDLYYEVEGKKGLARLQNALEKQDPYDMVFLDKHMPDMIGSELLKAYRESEKKYPFVKSIHAVSITGDVQMNDNEKELYDSFVNKPFKNSEIREVFKRLNQIKQYA